MNEVLKCIQERRSCRVYLDKEVEQEKIDLVLKAGTMAPSGKHLQSANIICIQNAEVVETLRAKIKEFMKRDPFYGAKVLILVCANKDSKFAVQDASCVLENMFLAATSLDLGSCWINCLHDFFATEDGNKFKKEVLNLNDEQITIGTCILGYAKGKSIAPKIKEDYIRYIK